MGLVPSETKTDLVAALAGVIPQPSFRADRAHRKEKGNVAAPSSDKVWRGAHLYFIKILI